MRENRDVRLELRRFVVRANAPFTAISLGYVLLRLWSMWHVFGTTPAVYPDTVGYERVSRLPVWSIDFWAGHLGKPAGTPLFWKLLPGSTAHAAPIAHWLLSVASWLVLAGVVASFLRHRTLRLFGFALILAYSLSPMITQWDGQLLSESLALSLLALQVAALLVFARDPSRRNVALLLLLTFASEATRLQSGVQSLLLILPVALVVALRGRVRPAMAAAAGAAVIFGWGYWALARIGPEIGLAENIAAVVLPSPEAIRYFVDRGMPVPPNLSYLIYYNRTPPSRFYEVPELADFRAWEKSRGQNVYFHYLLSHPSLSLWEPLRNLGIVVAPSRALPIGLDFFRPPGFRDSLLGPVRAVLYSDRGWLVVIWMAVAAAVGLILALDGLARRYWVVPATLLVSTLPNAIFVWDAGALGRDRHSLEIGILGRLGMWMMLLFAVDAALRLNSWRRDISSPGPTVG